MKNEPPFVINSMPTARRSLRCILLLLTIISSAAFKWNASIDRSTGIATSRETSRVPSSCNLHRALNASSTPSKLIENIFGRYPSWLAGWRVTFGLLRAVPVMDGRKGKQTAIRDSLFGVTLLSFGPGRFRARRNEYNMVIPIVGGVLALPSSKGTYGGLSFSLLQGDSNENSTVMETSIVDGYRPTIAGSAPVSRLRAGLYRSTQSLLHAYIMSRFHHYCYSKSD